MARKPAREAAMSLLYQKIFNQSIEENYLRALEDMSSDLVLDELDLPYINDILHGFDNHKDEIDNIIRANSEGWKFDRISKVDLSILRLALYEIKYRDDIPDSVAVNEAVELGKKYGGEKSGAFINGILGTYLRSLGDAED
jgi:N utilization substance protein B